MHPALPWLLLCGHTQGENLGFLILVDLGAPKVSLGVRIVFTI